MPDMDQLCAEERLRKYCRRCHRMKAPGDKHLRFYCPRCGEVSCGMKRMGKWMVMPHYRSDPDKPAVISDKLCRGGTVHPSEDRAP